MTQGYEANHSGKFLEETLRRELSSRGFLFRTHSDDVGNLDLFAPRVVVTRVPYKNLYKLTSYSEFVITDGDRKMRAECRWQETPGSVDEKFPYLIRNAIECMPESEVLFLLGGDGARPASVKWLHEEASKVSVKRIHVININGFLRFVRSEFGSGGRFGAAA